MFGAALFLASARLIPTPFSVYEWEWRSAGLIWRAPWGYLMVFAPLGILFALLAVALRRGLPVRTTTTAWLTLILWGLALRFPQVHGWASLLLSFAIALQLGRLVAKRPERTRAFLRWGGAAATAAALAARPAFHALATRSEESALAALPNADAKAPNVLFIIWDTVRAASLSLYGAAAPTSPMLDSIARGGVIFEEAYATAPWTLPSHASMFTGRYASATETDFAAALPATGGATLAEVFRQHGYATGGFTANLMATRAESGLARGFIRYEDFTSSAREILHSTPFTQADIFVVLLENLRTRRFWRIWGEVRKGNFENNFTVASHDVKKAPALSRDFLAWQESLPRGRPYFAFLNFFDAHDPYQPPAEDLEAVGGPAGGTLARYHGSIRYVDRHWGEMLQSLARRGALDNTIVVLTSDHGEQFGEHGLTLHGNSLYRQALHVPLVILHPSGVPAGVRVKAPVSLRDLPATVLALAGVPPEKRQVQGTPLTPLWRGAGTAPSEVISELSQHYRRSPTLRNRNGPMASVVRDSLHVIRDGDGGIEGYNVIVDPVEASNLATGGREAALATSLDSALARQQLKGSGGYARSARDGKPRDRTP